MDDAAAAGGLRAVACVSDARALAALLQAIRAPGDRAQAGIGPGWEGMVSVGRAGVRDGAPGRPTPAAPPTLAARPLLAVHDLLRGRRPVPSLGGRGQGLAELPVSGARGEEGFGGCGVGRAVRRCGTAPGCTAQKTQHPPRHPLSPPPPPPQLFSRYDCPWVRRAAGVALRPLADAAAACASPAGAGELTLTFPGAGGGLELEYGGGGGGAEGGGGRADGVESGAGWAGGGCTPACARQAASTRGDPAHRPLAPPPPPPSLRFSTCEGGGARARTHAEVTVTEAPATRDLADGWEVG